MLVGTKIWQAQIDYEIIHEKNNAYHAEITLTVHRAPGQKQRQFLCGPGRPREGSRPFGVRKRLPRLKTTGI